MFGLLERYLVAAMLAACGGPSPAAVGDGDVPDLSPVLGAVGWRPATRADLATGTQQAVGGPSATDVAGGTAVQVDLDGDGTVDIARLEVDTHGKVRLRFLARGLDLTPVQWPALHHDAGGLVATWLRAKRPGEAVLRDHLDPSAAAELTATGAVEVCEPPDGPATVVSAPSDQRCYCSTWWWLRDGQAKSTTVCD